MRRERIRERNNLPVNKDGRYVVYKMQCSVRERLNFALYYSILEANKYDVPVLTCFFWNDNYPEANFRSFSFLVEGLKDFIACAVKKGYSFEIRTSFPDKSELEDAVEVVMDCGYLHYQRQGNCDFTKLTNVRCVEIEDNLIVPIESASNKQEWAARTIRPKLRGMVDYFLEDANSRCPSLKNRKAWTAEEVNYLYAQFDVFLQQQKQRTPLSKGYWVGGEKKALKQLELFVAKKLPFYSDRRNDPSLSGTSNLSMYLHFGHISPLLIYRKVLEATGNKEFLEQLLVRRELAFNYVYYNKAYDKYEGIPMWCKKTLRLHRDDVRTERYTLEELERSATADIYWNAAMNEMRGSGFLENTMRMYWGKKIIEWSASPEEAYERALYLNNKYLLDGRDANSFVGVAWCFGLHDRPWKERPIFGTVRFMNFEGLRKKYKMDAYVDRYGVIEEL